MLKPEEAAISDGVSIIIWDMMNLVEKLSKEDWKPQSICG